MGGAAEDRGRPDGPSAGSPDDPGPGSPDDPGPGSPAARIETDRLVLRPFESTDLDAMAATLGDPVSMRFYPRPFTRDEAAAWIERNRERFAADGLGLWAIALRDSGEVVGDCGAVWQVVDGERELELGWHLHPTHQGRGYATEAARAWRTRAFAITERDRLISLILEDNAPSRRVAERIGMTVWKTAAFAGLPHLVYAIDR